MVFFSIFLDVPNVSIHSLKGFSTNLKAENTVNMISMFSLLPAVANVVSYTQSIPKLFPNYSQIIPKLFPNYSQIIPILFPNYSQIIPKLFPSSSQIIPKIVSKAFTKYNCPPQLCYPQLRYFRSYSTLNWVQKNSSEAIFFFFPHIRYPLCFRGKYIVTGGKNAKIP